MEKKILQFVFYFLKDVDLEEILVFNKIFLMKKTINTLLITCVMIIKLNSASLLPKK